MSTLAVDGAARTYFVHLPTHMGPAMPLVLDFHGAGQPQNGDVRQNGFDDLSDAQSFIMVYPRGLKMRWNDGRIAYPCAADDFGFVAALLGKLLAHYPIDPTRIYAAGFSNGATFVDALACHMPNTFAAIAAVSGTIPVAVKDTCKHAVSALQIDGTADQVMPYQGGELRSKGLAPGLVTSVDETLNIWAALDGCNGMSAGTKLPPLNPAGAERIWERTGLGCAAGYEVAGYAVIGGGHSWPGAAGLRASKQLKASETIIKFLLAHRLIK